MSALISLGANLGKPRENLLTACSYISQAFAGSTIRASHLYLTPAIGGPSDQNPFFNAVLALEGNHDPFVVWNHLRSIEQQLGRQRNIRWEARLIDLDVLFVDQQRIWTPRFKVPHPRTASRMFILAPALEVASQWLDPVSQCTLHELASLCQKPKLEVGILCQKKSLRDAIEQQVCCELDRQSDITWRREHQAIAVTSLQARLRFLECPPDDAKIDAFVPDKMMQFLHANECDPSLGTWSVACVASPDPTTIAWEDFTRPWAEALGLLESSQPLQRWKGPRYLLPADSIEWAAHELVSMLRAMRCPIEQSEAIRL
ncbi:MAG: 2-amino-4-hydroxy-6-hydroxymethyldihydropteridine diphosphokinase [Pirellulales bacterium]